MTYTETRTLDATALRSLCIRHDWYTCGTCEEYNALFDKLYDEDGCPVNLTTQKLSEIAADIMAHSEITDYTITSVMYELNTACTVTFDEDHDPLAEPASLWLKTSINSKGTKRTSVINDARLVSMLAHLHFLKQAGEDIHVHLEHDRMYHATAYIITRTYTRKGETEPQTVTHRYERI